MSPAEGRAHLDRILRVNPDMNVKSPDEVGAHKELEGHTNSPKLTNIVGAMTKGRSESVDST